MAVMLKDATRDFLQFLKLNRNASPHTVRAYDTDLTQFVTYLAARAKIKPSQVITPKSVEHALRVLLAIGGAPENARSDTTWAWTACLQWCASSARRTARRRSS